MAFGSRYPQLFDPSREKIVRIVETFAILGLVTIVAVSVKNIVMLWNFVGSSVTILVSFILPPLFYLRIRKPTMKSSMTVPAYILVIFGVISLILCTTESIRDAAGAD